MCCCLACFLRAFSPSDVGYGPWPGAMPCAVTGIMFFLFLLVSPCLSSRSLFRASACPALHCTLLISAVQSFKTACVGTSRALPRTDDVFVRFLSSHSCVLLSYSCTYVRRLSLLSFVHTTMPVPTFASDPRPCTPCHAMRSPLLLDSASDPDSLVSRLQF